MNDSTDALLMKADQEVLRGRYSEAGAIIEGILQKEPRHASALDAAAKLACLLGYFDDAINYARQACRERPIVEHVLTLASAFKWKQDYNAARQHYKLILDQVPQHYDALAGLADLYASTGYQSSAVRCYELLFAQDRFHHLGLFMLYAKLFPYDRASDMLVALEKLLPRENAVPPEDYLRYQMEYVVRKESASRASRGLTQLARTTHEMFFPSATPERDAVESKVDAVLAKYPTLPFALEAKFFCLVSRGARKEAGDIARTLADMNPDKIWPSIVFDERSYHHMEAQSDEALVGAFPDMTDVVCRDFIDAPIIFLSCDYKYFLQLARPFLASIDAIGPGTQVHLHVMDLPDDRIADVRDFCENLRSLTVAISAEKAAISTPVYYHAVRFVRQYQLLRRYKKPIWIFDVDALLNRDPQAAFESAADADVGVRAHAGMWAPWNQFVANVVAINPTERGVAFSRLVAAYIAVQYAGGRLRWGVDQMALYGVYAFLGDNQRAPKVKLFDDRMIDVEYRDDGIVWGDGGIKKLMPLSVLTGEDGNLDSPRVKYRGAFDKYAV